MIFPGALESNLVETSATARRGDTVTASGTAHTKGAYTELIASTALATVGVIVGVSGVSANNADTSALLDIATGAASSEVVVFPDLNIGHAKAATPANPRLFFLPLSIAAGTRIAARSQSVISSDTCLVAIWLVQSGQHVAGASSVVAYGEATGSSNGTSVTPGNNVWGSWTEIATTSADHNLWTFGVTGQGDTTIQAQYYALQFGYGGTSSPDTTPDMTLVYGSATSEQVNGIHPAFPFYADISSGTKLWVRIAASNTSPFGIIIHGMEGTVQSEPTATPHNPFGHPLLGPFAGPVN